MYQHWSFGKRFAYHETLYRKGLQGLAYEIVINSNPVICYIMEENSMTMQTLVIAHAAFGHNHFFKNNYLFRQWTDAEGILDYLAFARDYTAKCEERYGVDAVERVIDAAHALRDHEPTDTAVQRYGRDTGEQFVDGSGDRAPRIWRAGHLVEDSQPLVGRCDAQPRGEARGHEADLAERELVGQPVRGVHGEAVDLNPVENPYVGCGMTRDKGARRYLDRERLRRGMVTPAVVQAFAAAGWGWGGSWSGTTKDYMHFSASGH